MSSFKLKSNGAGEMSSYSLRPRLPRTNHFGFQAATTNEVREARERLRAAGVEEVEWQDDDVTVRVQVLDPDGYRVELYAFGR